MGINYEQSYIMAKRLKDLRGDYDLSHEGLSKELYDRYGVKISSDSLMNYEVTDPYHTKARKNQGMRIEYLSILSDFYGVSSDYLMGRSNAKSIDQNMSAVMEFTGLTERSVESIRILHTTEHLAKNLNVLNWLLSNLYFIINIMSYIDDYKVKCQDFFALNNAYFNLMDSYDDRGIAIDEEINRELTERYKVVCESEDKKDIVLFRINKLFGEILDGFIGEFCDKDAEFRNNINNNSFGIEDTE